MGVVTGIEICYVVIVEEGVYIIALPRVMTYVAGGDRMHATQSCWGC